MSPIRRLPCLACCLVGAALLAGAGLGAAERSPVGVWSAAAAKTEAAGAASEVAVRIRFDADGTYTIRRGEMVTVEGIFDVFEDELLFTDVAGPDSCARDDHAMATYRWKLQKNRLVLTRVDDDCPGRVALLGAGPLARVKDGG